MLFEFLECRRQLVVEAGQSFGQGAEIQGRVCPGDDVLALGPPEELATRGTFAGRQIAREGHPAAGDLVEVAEDHRLYVDRCASAVIEPGMLPEGTGPGRMPGGEDGADGRRQLLPWISGKSFWIPGEKSAAHLAGGRAVVAGDLGVAVEDDPAVHEEEAPVAVPGEVLVVGSSCERVADLFVEAHVEHGVQHAGHGVARTRAHTDEQGVSEVTEAAAGGGFQLRHGLVDLFVQLCRPSAGEEGPAGVGRDGEAVRDGEAEHRGHLGQVGALAAEPMAQRARARVVVVVEGEDEAFALWPRDHTEPSARRSMPSVRIKSWCSSIQMS